MVIPEKRLSEIDQQLDKDKINLLSSPSASGKTTFAEGFGQAKAVRFGEFQFNLHGYSLSLWPPLLPQPSGLSWHSGPIIELFNPIPGAIYTLKVLITDPISDLSRFPWHCLYAGTSAALMQEP